MKTTILLFTALLFVAGSAIAGNGSYANNGEEITFIKNNKKLPDQYVQRYFRSSDVWKKFTLKNGKWYVEFDELSGSPHRAFGKPIAINAAGNLQTKALHFLNTELKDYMIAANDIHFVGSTVGEKLNYVNFVQYHKGKEVLFSSLTLRISHNDKVMMFGLDIYKDMDINVNPALSPQDAMSKAVQGLVSKIVNTGYNKELKILPIPEEDGYVHRLVYEVTVHTTNVDRIPGKYYTLIDAHTGEIVYRQNQVLSCTPPQPPPPINIQVQGTLFPTHPYDPFAVIPLPYVKVTTTSSVYTDDQGQLILAGAGPVSATISLEGRWCKVVFDNGTVAPSITTILNSGSNTIDFDSVTDIKHLTAYYHITKVHDYFKAKTGLTVMDIQMIANVDVAGSSCNAYYNGDCNFYAESSTCNSIALVGDVAYHEYGHGINYEAYQAYGANFSSGSLGEGYSDLWAMGITEVPEIGIGFYKMSQNGIRSYSGAPKVYPDDITGQVHNDGQIIAGAWWDVGVNFGNVQTMMDLFADHYAGTPNGPTGAEGQVFRDVLVEALLVDDNDADLSNGTPNDQDIACAFGRHGITLITDVDSVHAELLTHIANDPIPMTADNSYPWYYNGADIHYKVNPSGSWNVVAMTDTMNQFEGFIPGQPAGSIIYYYLSFDDICNNSTAYPQGVDAASNPNIPYVIMVGFYEHDLQDFDNFNSGWTIGDAADGATTGVWEIASPVASYTNVSNKIPANLVQTGTDHTPNDNNNFCAVTGNAATSNIIQGNNDVDGGATTLYSPVYDLTGFQNPAFDYYRWYTNNTGNSPNNDFWKVQVSNDGTNWSTIENILVTDRSWRHYGFRVGDYILPSSTTSIRFIAADFPAGSIVEAAIDDLRLWDIVEKVSSTEDISVDYSIYPNPSNGNFVLELGNVPVSLSLYNTLGQQVKQPVVVNAFEKYVINASDLDAGVYLLRLEAEGQLYFEKLMLIKE